jgi:hypothetical protein
MEGRGANTKGDRQSTNPTNEIAGIHSAPPSRHF